MFRQNLGAKCSWGLKANTGRPKRPPSATLLYIAFLQMTAKNNHMLNAEGRHSNTLACHLNSVCMSARELVVLNALWLALVHANPLVSAPAVLPSVGR